MDNLLVVEVLDTFCDLPGIVTDGVFCKSSPLEGEELRETACMCRYNLCAWVYVNVRGYV